MGGRVLVVDDDEAICEIIDILLNRDHEITVVKDGDSALRAVGRRHFDAVVTDYLMPHMNGVELGFLLRRRRPKLKVVVFSAVQEGADKLDPIWADMFVSKSDIGELPDVIDKVVAWDVQTEAWLMATPKRWATPRNLPLCRTEEGTVTGFLRSFGEHAQPVVYLSSGWPVPDDYFEHPYPRRDYIDFDDLVGDGWRIATPLSVVELRERRTARRR